MTLLEQAAIFLYVLWLGIVGWGLYLLARGAPAALEVLAKRVVRIVAGWTLRCSLRLLLWTGNVRRLEPAPSPAPMQLPCNCRDCQIARLRMASTLLQAARVEVGRC